MGNLAIANNLFPISETDKITIKGIPSFGNQSPVIRIDKKINKSFFLEIKIILFIFRVNF